MTNKELTKKDVEDEIFKLKERHRLLIHPDGVGKDTVPYQLRLLRLIDKAYRHRSM